jgi:Ni,Fe-hydrogenase I cytochrome b subunit
MAGRAKLLTSPPAIKLNETADNIVVRCSAATCSWSSSWWNGPRAPLRRYTMTNAGAATAKNPAAAKAMYTVAWVSVQTMAL